jgi:hypothetical protein
MSKVEKIDLTTVLRNYLLGLITCADYIYPHRIAFNYAQALALRDGSQYAFIVTIDIYVESLQELIDESGLGDYIIVTTYDEPVFLRYDNSIVIFDSLSSLMGDFSDNTNVRNLFIMLKTLNDKFCQVLAVIDSNMSNESITQLCGVQPESFIFLSDHAAGTEFDSTTGKLYFPRMIECDITMTKEQEIKINSIIKDQPDPLNWLSDKYRIANDKYKDEEGNPLSPKKYFNIVYPFNVEKAIKDNYDTIETLESIVNLFGPKEILKHSPKFRDIIDNIIKYKKKDGAEIYSRRVIFTAYPNVDNNDTDGDFGGDLLWIYLKEIEGLNVKCLYNYHSYEDKMSIMQDFNEGDTNILITNCYFVTTPKNVDHFHIVDSDLKTAFDMIDVMFKKLNYGTENSNPTLDVHLHYTQKDKSENSRLTYDSFDFICFKEYILRLQDEKQRRFDEGWRVERSSTSDRYNIIVPSEVAKILSRH